MKINRTISNDFLVTYGVLNILGLGRGGFIYMLLQNFLFLSNNTVKFDKEKGILKLGRSHTRCGQVFRTFFCLKKNPLNVKEYKLCLCHVYFFFC